MSALKNSFYRPCQILERVDAFLPTVLCCLRKNMILVNVIEERYVDPADYSIKPTTDSNILVFRNLAQAMIPGSRLARVEIERSVYSETMQDILER